MKKPLKPWEIRAKKKQLQFLEATMEDGMLSDKDAKYLSLTVDLDWNQQLLESFIGNNEDIIFRRFRLSEQVNKSCLVVYVDGLVNDNVVNGSILKNLMIELSKIKTEMAGHLRPNILEGLAEHFLTVGEVAVEDNLQHIITAVLSGETAIIVDQEPRALIIDTRGWPSRSIEDAAAEAIIRGPRESFTETLRVNTTLIRRKIRSSDLKIEMLNLGAKTKTDIAIAYLNGVVNPKVVKEVKVRLNRIDIDSVLESGYLEELIEDSPYSPFPQIQSTERPDKVVANILEGRVAIIVDHTPFVLLVPTLFIQFFQASEDYYDRSFATTALRMVRIIAFVISLSLPAIYVAAIDFHQEMIPFALALSIAAGREGVPFPAFLEAALMGMIFEILREAGVRLPRPVGQAVSIVGALVIGEAAVTAGIVSPIMVIVAALTAISSFALPNYSMIISTTVIRFVLTMLAAIIGYYGLIWGLLVMYIHLLSLRSFGVPYMSPIAPGNLQGLKDSVIRVPWWLMITRPYLITKGKSMRMKQNLQPSPNNEGESRK